VSGSWRNESVEKTLVDETGFGSSMAGCLRAQARREPSIRLAAMIGKSPLSAEAKRLYLSSLANLGATAVAVKPLVVLIGVSELVRGRMRAPVPVLHLGDLATWLLRQPTMSSDGEVEQLLSDASRVSGWQVHPAATNASVRLTARFERLRAEVDLARRRLRVSLVAGGATALATAAVLLVVAPAIVDSLSG